MQIISPKDIELKLVSLELKFLKFLLKFKYLELVILVFSSLYLYKFFYLWTRQMPDWSRFFIIQDRYWASITLFFGYFIYRIFPTKFRGLIQFFVLILSWIIPCYVLKITRPIIIATPAFLVFFTLFLKLPRPTWIQKLISLIVLASLFSLTVWLLGQDAYYSGDYRLFRYFWTIHVEYLLIYFISWAIQDKKINSTIALNPVQLSSPFPWTENLKKITTPKLLKENRTLGFINLLQSQILLTLLFFLLPIIPNDMSIFSYFLKYISFFVFISVSFNAVTGFLRLYDYQTVDGTYYPMLAKNPLELWQRGSVYVAKFLFDLIYFPIWKRTRKVWLSSLFVIVFIYFHLFLFHEFFIRQLLHFIVPQLPISTATPNQFLFLPLIWIGIWLSWIFIFYLITKKISWFSTNLGQWVCVIVTHIGSLASFQLIQMISLKLGVG